MFWGAGLVYFSTDLDKLLVGIDELCNDSTKQLGNKGDGKISFGVSNCCANETFRDWDCLLTICLFDDFMLKMYFECTVLDLKLLSVLVNLQIEPFNS